MLKKYQNYFEMPESQEDAISFCRQFIILNDVDFFTESFDINILVDFYGRKPCVVVEYYEEGVKIYHTDYQTDEKIHNIKSYIREKKLKRICT